MFAGHRIGAPLPAMLSASGASGRPDRRIDDRRRVVRDVDQELVAGAHGVGEVDRRQPIAFHQDVIGRAGDAVRALHRRPAASRAAPLMKLP